jgi:hypothetical protein
MLVRDIERSDGGTVVGDSYTYGSIVEFKVFSFCISSSSTHGWLFSLFCSVRGQNHQNRFDTEETEEGFCCYVASLLVAENLKV